MVTVVSHKAYISSLYVTLRAYRAHWYSLSKKVIGDSAPKILERKSINKSPHLLAANIKFANIPRIISCKILKENLATCY